MKNIPLFRQSFIFYVVTLCSGFLGFACFGVEYADPATQLRLIDNVTIFILGTALSITLGFVLGSSQGSKDKISAPSPVVPGEDIDVVITDPKETL